MGMGQQGFGKYQLREQLGRGGMAEVWKAWDSQLERFVAIKLLHADLQHDPDFLTRFAREARVIASLHNPNIINIHDFQIFQSPESKGTLAYMVMDYVDGGTLTHYINSTSLQGNYPPAANIAHLFTSISQAIDYAHQHGMIHRDIKPANILMDRHLIRDNTATQYPMGEPILTDFGIVKLLGSPNATLSGFWLGTPLYISPEQAQGKSGDERSDIYSLGVILYEICAGVRPFTGDNTFAIIMQHINTMPIPPEQINPNVSPALSKVIMRSLAKDPAERFASASDMASALTQAFHLFVPEYLDAPTSGVSVITDASKNISRPNQPSTATFSSPLSVPRFNMEDAVLRLEGGAVDTGNDSVSNNRSTFAPPPAIMTPVARPVSIPFLPSSERKKPRKALLIAILTILIIALSGSGLGVFFLHSLQRSIPATGGVVGHAFFLSTGQLGKSGTQGLNDELQINLSGIQNPSQGKSYYVWLLSDKNQSPMRSILLGKLHVTSGNAALLYSGDQQHSDLLATFSRLLITEEDFSGAPRQPAVSQSAWRYYAELPQEPNSLTSTRAIDYLRFMLSEDPLLTPFGIHGGTNLQLYRDAQQVAGLVDSAHNSQNASFIRQQLITILDYLDGVSFVKLDVPPGTPILADPMYDQVPLLNIITDETQDPSGYLHRLDSRLTGLINFTDISQDMNKLATQIDLDVSNDIQTWLYQVRLDAKQLLGMTNVQLLLPSSQGILIDMQTQAHNAFDGHIDLATGKEQSGIAQVYSDVQRLATFDVALYKPR